MFLRSSKKNEAKGTLPIRRRLHQRLLGAWKNCCIGKRCTGWLYLYQFATVWLHIGMSPFGGTKV